MHTHCLYTDTFMHKHAYSYTLHIHTDASSAIVKSHTNNTKCRSVAWKLSHTQSASVCDMNRHYLTPVLEIPCKMYRLLSIITCSFLFESKLLHYMFN